MFGNLKRHHYFFKLVFSIRECERTCSALPSSINNHRSLALLDIHQWPSMAEIRGVGVPVGPRVLGRLTPELILKSPQYMNCVGEYEIDLRANRINAIENLGTTENQFDSIDLSDNAVVRLEGFPKLPRLKVLHLNNNRINRIAWHLEEAIPNLEWLMMTNNKLTNLADLDPLQSLPKLRYLSLIDNPVTKQASYRLYVISRCKKLKVLDFRKVKQRERDEAARVFGGEAAAPAQAAATFEPDEELAEAAAALKEAEQPAIRKGPTPEEMTAIKAAIANASTLEEVRRLEAALVGGHLPSEVQVGGGGGAGDGAAAMDEG